MSVVWVIDALPLGGPFGLDDGHWHGDYRSIDGASAGPIKPEQVKRIVATYEDDDRWDGDVAAVFQLTDGRYVAYETTYGPTGHGFAEDAYGGEADVFFAYSLGRLAREALTQHAREMLDLSLAEDVEQEAIPGAVKRLDLSRPAERKLSR